MLSKKERNVCKELTQDSILKWALSISRRSSCMMYFSIASTSSLDNLSEEEQGEQIIPRVNKKTA